MASRPAHSSSSLRHRPSADLAAPPQIEPADRKAELIDAARAVIAERGFEGLRTREVAERIGLNHATLHHYFPTKEALIAAVVREQVQRLKTYRAALRSGEAPAREALRAYFAAARAQMRAEPEALVVLQEFFLRASRSATLARIVGELDRGWGGHLTSLLTRGIEEGAFRPDLDVEAAAHIIMAFFKGLGGPPRDAAAIERQLAQLEAWIVVDRANGGAARRSGKKHR
jgi:AcrR family transcriptional regulator